MKREKSTYGDPLSIEKEKRREGWGATCKFSRGNRRLPNSPIPLAPHLARDWNCWEESDESGDEGEITLRSLDQYHRKISLCKRAPKSGVIRKKRDTPSSPLLIRSLSVCSQPPPPPFKSPHKNSSPDLELATSPVAKHGFRTIFSARRANKTGQYQWVQSNERDTSTDRREDNPSHISCLRVGSSPALTSQRHPVSPSNTVSPSNGLSHPATLQFPGSSRPKTSSTNLNLRPASSQTLPIEFHRPVSSHITGRAGLKGYFLPLANNSSRLKQGEMLRICVKTEAIKCSSAPLRGPHRTQVPEPPAPSPLVPH